MSDPGAKNLIIFIAPAFDLQPVLSIFLIYFHP
jgi:hypothetical protein